MATKIGKETGIEAARVRWNASVRDDDPEMEGDFWPDKLAATLQTLVAGHNEYEDRLRALEARAPVPFP